MELYLNGGRDSLFFSWRVLLHLAEQQLQLSNAILADLFVQRQQTVGNCHLLKLLVDEPLEEIERREVALLKGHLAHVQETLRDDGLLIDKQAQGLRRRGEIIGGRGDRRNLRAAARIVDMLDDLETVLFFLLRLRVEE